MNIELQCCGLAMLVVLGLIFFREKSLDYSGRRRFSFAALSCIFCLILDIASIVFIDLAVDGVVPRVVTEYICKIYLVSLVLQAYQGFRYAAGDFFAAGSHVALKIASLLFFAAGSILIIVLPIDFLRNGRIVYSFGPSAIATYAVVVVLIFSAIASAFLTSNNESRRWSILIWQTSWIIAAAIQLFVPQLLLVGFAAAFGIVLIYCELENPHEGIDRVTGQFTSNALLSYAFDLFVNKKKFSSIVCRIEFVNKNFDLKAERELIVSIARTLGSIKNEFTFRFTDKTFVVIYKNADSAKEGYAELRRVIGEKISVPMNLTVAYAPDSDVFSSSDEFMRFLHYWDNEAESVDLVTVDEHLINDMRRYDETVESIKSALAEDRVVVYYQPIYNVSKRAFNSAEALVRIIGKDGKLIPPNDFIPIAEESGLIIPLGKEVFRKACEFLSKGKARALGLDYVEVNLSPVQFGQDDPAEFVEKIMNDYNVDPKWINLEITETDSASVKQFFLKNMNRLIERGVSFSLDDFGTGRSNLDYFVAMPVGIIKFDFTFTQSYFKNEKAKYVMEGVVELMKKMGLRIVAEGVETEKQFTAMCDLGVSYVQGYYFSRPVSEDDFLEFLKTNNAAAI